jgi:hypothetical protein
LRRHDLKLSTPLTRHPSYHGDKLLRLALLSELIERRSPSGIGRSAKGGHGACFAVMIGAMRFITKGNSVADLNDMALFIFRSLPGNAFSLCPSAHISPSVNSLP